MWLVKWFLAIPHLIVLALLWLAVIPLTVVAGVAILFTGRYPRAIFEFNVGVLRWTWRVVYYAFYVLGTDRYPPFSLHSDPNYPADLAIDYPQRLSRGLVLVKWWLLAIPHYIVVALFTSGWLGWSVRHRRQLARYGQLQPHRDSGYRRRRDPRVHRAVPAAAVRLRDGHEPVVLPGARLRHADAR